jgi:hypothetical protein
VQALSRAEGLEMLALTWTCGQLCRVLAERLRRFLLVQLLVLVPGFWLLELGQNVAFRWMNGDWAWVYPESAHRWYSVVSLGLWSAAVVGLWALHTYWFRPLKVAPWQRVLWATLACWGGHWLFGFVAAEAFHHPLQVWPGSRLTYVSFSALFFWAAIALVYQWVAPGGAPAPVAVKQPLTRAERPAGA